MKRILPVLAIVIMIVVSCKKDDPAINAKKDTGDGPSLTYNDSYKAWTGYKSSVHNSYTYTVVTSSFSGFGTETKISVSNGAVSARDYTQYQYHDGINKIIVKQWHEDQAGLGAHAGEGAELLTLDQIYTKAKNVWLKADPKSNDIYFETKNNGIISSCGFVPIGCMDDCFNGVNITAVGGL